MLALAAIVAAAPAGPEPHQHVLAAPGARAPDRVALLAGATPDLWSEAAAASEHVIDEIFQRPQSSLGHMIKLTHLHRPFLRALDEYNSSSWLGAELRRAAHNVGASDSSADHIDGIWVR